MNETVSAQYDVAVWKRAAGNVGTNELYALTTEPAPICLDKTRHNVDAYVGIKGVYDFTHPVEISTRCVEDRFQPVPNHQCRECSAKLDCTFER